MTTRVIRYRTRADQGDVNEALVRDVFDALERKHPPGVRYRVLRLPDGAFEHVVIEDTPGAVAALTALPAFRAFQEGIRERCEEPPQVVEATLVGAYPTG